MAMFHRAVRIRRGILQTGVHTWTRGNRTVTLVGTIHIGDRRYYQILQRLLDDGEEQGALVHFEGTKEPTDEAFASLTNADRRALDLMGDGQTFAETLVTATTGLVTQTDAMTFRSSWVNTDVSELDVIRMVGPQNIVNRFSSFSRTPDMSAISRLPPMIPVGWFIRFALRYFTAASSLLRAIRPGELDRNVLVKWRNMVAVTAALNTPDGSHVIAVWGSEHVGGIGALLERNGFALTTVRWIPAIGRTTPAGGSA
jgi:hypothetical protein